MSDTKQVPVFVYESILENVTLTIVFRNNIWMTNAIEAGRVMSNIQATINPQIRSFRVTEHAVTFTGD